MDLLCVGRGELANRIVWALLNAVHCVHHILWISLLLLLTACAASPVKNIQQVATEAGFDRQVIVGGAFQHLVYSTRTGKAHPARWHVYIHGDGTPWLGQGRPAWDPTPRNPLLLKLMVLDEMPSIYLGRPCYGGLAAIDPHCQPWSWTHGRYAETVVESLAQALQRLIEQHRLGQITLIGYSGGGTLAMLLAQRIEKVDTLVTLAANIDIDQWADQHAYSRLTTSLNPALVGPLRDSIIQFHWVGERDDNVSPDLLRKALHRQPNARLSILREADHSCCWIQSWPTLLEEINRTYADRRSGSEFPH